MGTVLSACHSAGSVCHDASCARHCLLQNPRNYPLISTYEGEFVNIFHSLDHRTSIISPIQNSAAAENKDNYIVKSDDEQHIYETGLVYLNGVLDKVFRKTDRKSVV